VVNASPRAMPVDAPLTTTITTSTLVHCLTFADRATIYLHALAASVMHFNDGRPLHVLGLSARRTPRTSSVWNSTTRRAIKGTDPGKLKKLWFVGAFVNDVAALRRLGIGTADLHV
jgi:hypothetical protein